MPEIEIPPGYEVRFDDNGGGTYVIRADVTEVDMSVPEVDVASLDTCPCTFCESARRSRERSALRIQLQDTMTVAGTDDTWCDDCERPSCICDRLNDYCDRCSERLRYCECHYYCQDCGDYVGGSQRRRNNCSCAGGRIQSYSYRPSPVFHGEGPLFLGMELEMETRDRLRAADVATQGFGDLVYLKEDGSIMDGFEMVTHPMDHAYAMNEVDWSTLDRLRLAGAHIHSDNNGLHVHVSRAGFASDCHVYRWVRMIYRNAPHVSTVARRTSDQWAPFARDARQLHMVTAKKTQTSLARNYSYQAGRYQAINTQNDPTLEVRVFAASLDPMVVKGTLSFVASTVEYTRGLSTQDILRNDGWSWRQYTSWLRSKDAHAFKPATTYLESVCAC